MLGSNRNKLAKILIKLLVNDTDNVYKWVHLCYLPKKLYEQYSKEKHEDVVNLNKTLSRWATQDFDKEVSVITQKDLENLKELVKDYCKEAYPDVYLEQSTDRQGWLRVWISKKMKEELEANGK